MRRLLVGLAIAGIAFLSPLAAIADDDQIAHQIIAKLKEHQRRGELKGFDLDLLVEDGMVMLKGQVSSKAQEKLGWTHTTPFSELVSEMVKSDINLLLKD